MEVKPGYKQTEVGIIPEEWEVSGLQQACRQTITYGIVQCGPHIRDGVPYIRVSDMDEPELTVDAMLRTSKSIASKFARSTVEEGDLVYALRGKLGEVRQVRAELAGANLTQGTARLSPDDRLASDYLVWAMRDPRTVRQAELEAKGTTFREITLADLRRIKVLLPPKPEQRAIATALSDVDGLLRGLDRLIAKKRDLKQAAMQQLLTGQTRLPGFHGDWEEMNLGELCDYVDGVTTSGGDLGYLEIGDVNVETKSYDVAQKEKLSVRGAVKVPSGTLLISTVRPTRGAIVVTKSSLHVSSAFCRVRPANGLLFHLVCQPKFLVYLGENSFGGTYPTCRDETILGYETPLPNDPAEQTAIAEVLTDMDAELAALEQRREKTRALKQAMMQELLTGRTRLV